MTSQTTLEDDATRVVGGDGSLEGDLPPVIEAPADGGLTPGVLLGRYVVLEEVGRGGMGSVHRAYDPKLGREVAIKRLAPSSGRLSTEGAARMLREAQAMAKLSHPNVVPVYDVEGDGAELFIAMELVVGSTLRQWLKAERRPWREVVAVFLEAGEGLAVAHDAGLVHRDFKPGNVMLGEDGRARVMDFGLARVDAPSRSGTGSHPTLAFEVEEEVSDDALTRAGTVIGTPAYMAPEQFGDEAPPGPAADQYAFCIALWEALYGARPFSTKDYRELFAAKLEGPPPPPRDGRVPPWIHRVVERGLAVEPTERWPSMRALLDALADDPAAKRRRIAVGVVGVALLGVASWSLASAPRAPDPCEGSAAELRDVWSDQAREAMTDALTTIDLGYAEDTARRAAERLDAYADAWRQGHEDACRATHERKTQSADVLDRRMACLSAARAELAAVVQQLSVDVTEKTVERTGKIVDGLPALARCGDVEALLADVPPPEDPEVAERVEGIRARLAEVSVLQRAGRVPDALEAIPAIVEDAEATGYMAIHARALLLQARVETIGGEFETATEHAEHAYLLGSEAGDDHLAARAAVELGFILGDRRGLTDQAHQWLRIGGALTRRTARGKVAEAWYFNNLGNVLKSEGRTKEAIEAYGKAEALFTEQLGPDHRYVGMAVGNAGIALNEQHRPNEALPLLERAVELDRTIDGPKHPSLGTGLTNLGLALHSLHRYDEALARHTQARDIFAASLGTDHPHYAAALTNMGMTLASLDRLDEAEPLLLESLRIKEARLGPDSKALVPQLVNLGLLTSKRDRPEQTLAHMERARGILVAHHGEDHPFVAMVDVNIGTSHVQAGRTEQGLQALRRAVTYYEEHDGKDAPSVGHAVRALGDALIAAKDEAGAIAAFERARKIQLATDAPAPELADTRFRLAELYWSDPARRDEARRLAKQALEGLGDLDPAGSEKIRTWIAEHP